MVKKWMGFLSIALSGLLFIACPAENGTTDYNTGTATATASSINGLISVTVTMKDGVVTDVVISGSDHVGAEVLEKARGQILASGDFAHINKELTTPVDGYSSATVTRDNIKKAGEEAVAKIRRGEFDGQ
jgi:uncharacterized protein with FMN-binding domain